MLLQIQVLNVEEQKQLQKIWDTDYQAIVSGKDNGVPFLKIVFKLHFKLFGETCSTCPNKIPGYVKKIKSLNPQNSKIMSQDKTTTVFRLQDSVTIPVAGTSHAYSQHNLTDEIAVELIAKNPNRKALFVKLPDNIDELIAEFNSTNGQEDTDEKVLSLDKLHITVEQALSVFEKMNVKTKATSESGLNKKIGELSEEQKAEFLNLVSEIKDISGQDDAEQRTSDEINFDIDQAEQELEELLANSPDATESIEALNQKITDLKVELDNLK